MIEEQRELYNFQINEIKQVNPHPNEDVKLKLEKRILENSERIYQLSSEIYNAFYEEENSVYELLSSSECKSAEVTVREISNFLGSYMNNIEYSPERLEQIRERLAVLSNLARRYGGSIEACIKYLDKIEKSLQSMSNMEERLKELEGSLGNEMKLLSRLSVELSKERKKAAVKLEQKVVNALKSLGIEHADFKVKMERLKDEKGWVAVDGERYKAFENGMDKVEFYITTNIGEDLKPLVRVASGGEISRVMLAIKSILAENDHTPTLIFDELDTGISGRIARAVGEKLRDLSKYHQIICITHLPQIAGLADHHFCVSKRVKNGRTVTEVRELKGKERAEEIAKLLGGAKVTEITIKSAEELLKKEI
ncbi:MAG: DNA repair protein RecN [Fidelibacterota bacterium]